MHPLPFVFFLCLSAYLVGAIPFALLISKWHHIDCRQEGSGNVGATNITRILGRRWGILCFFLDAGKGALPVWVLSWMMPSFLFESHVELIGIAVAFSVVIGHIWSPYIGFKGGKGVATSAGVVLVLAPFPFICAFIIWGLVLKFSHYVALASISAALALPLSALLLNSFFVQKSSVRSSHILLGMMIILGIVVIFKHKSNIIRLINGTEYKLELNNRGEEE